MGPVFGGLTLQNQHLFHLCVGVGSLPTLRGLCTWAMRMLRRVTDFFPWLFSRARAKTSLSLLTTGWKKQYYKLWALPLSRPQWFWTISLSFTSLHGVCIPPRNLLTCLGRYRCYRHCNTSKDWFDRLLLPFASSHSQTNLGHLATGCTISQVPQSWVSLLCLHTVGQGPHHSKIYCSPCCWAVSTASAVISEVLQPGGSQGWSYPHGSPKNHPCNCI